MRVYRIEREKYLDDTLKGYGAAKNDGFRWNSLYTYMVYTSQSRALALLEVSVHLDLNEDLPNDRYFVEIEIPDELVIMELRTDFLPDNWSAKPPGRETQFIGDDFVAEGSGVVLKVPSAIVQREFNYLINPNHLDALKIQVVGVERFVFDSRLGKFGADA